MLSIPARSLLGISSNEVLPLDPAALYDAYFAGRAYLTRFGEGWEFLCRGREVRSGFDHCLIHRTAQFDFALDSELRVYVECSRPIQIASNIVSLVEKDGILVSSRATGQCRRGLGQFPSYEAFLATHGDYLSNWPEAEFDDKAFGRFFLGPSSVVGVGRFYSDEYLIGGIEYL
jgi:hypothetical protein